MLWATSSILPLSLPSRVLNAALAACSLSRGFLAWHGLVAFAGWTFPLSDYAFRCWDSLNSTLSLGLAAALCVWLRQTGPCPSGAAGRTLGDRPR